MQIFNKKPKDLSTVLELIFNNSFLHQKAATSQQQLTVIEDTLQLSRVPRQLLFRNYSTTKSCDPTLSNISKLLLEL